MAEIILSPENMIKLDNAITECVNSLVRAQAEKDFRAEVLANLKEEFGLSVSDLNPLIKQRFDESISKKMEKLEKVIELDEALKTARRNQRVVTINPDDLAEGEDVGDVDV